MQQGKGSLKAFVHPVPFRVAPVEGAAERKSVRRAPTRAGGRVDLTAGVIDAALEEVATAHRKLEGRAIVGSTVLLP